MIAAAAAAGAGDAEYLRSLVWEARWLRLGDDPAWRVLLHYRDGWLGGVESDVDDERFFLAPDGRTNPYAELEATLAAFVAPPPADPSQDARCRFPARFAWLRDRLAFDPARVPARACPKLDAWLGALDAGGVSVVFATAYLNAPGSMYGHTLLRLQNRTRGVDQPLLSYTINFAADVTTDSAIVYAWKGLTGGFRGRFSTMPFYMKAQEYSNLESRDLWEYRLRFSQSQVDRLLLHAWEMGAAQFDYYFFTENCSYQLLTLIESADPSLGSRLSDRFPGPTIPADTVRALIDAGLTDGVSHRGSFLADMLARRARLSPAEADVAHALVRRPDGGFAALARLAPARQALVLDAAQAYARWRHGFSANVPDAERALERRLLLARGKLRLPAVAVDAPPRTGRPDAGHASSMVALAGGVAREEASGRDAAFGELDFRPALHDLGARPDGYPPDTELAMAHLALRFEHPGDDVFVERFDLVRITSLAPLDPWRWVRKPSWRVAAGWDLARELGCTGWRCGYGGVEGGLGVAAETRVLLRRRQVWYATADAEFAGGFPFEDGWRLGGGGAAGVVVAPARAWRLHGEARYRAYAGDSRRGPRFSLAQSFSPARNLELRLGVETRRTQDAAYDQIRLAFIAYF